MSTIITCNELFGDVSEFSGDTEADCLAQLQNALRGCGYPYEVTDFKEGRDYTVKATAQVV